MHKVYTPYFERYHGKTNTLDSCNSTFPTYFIDHHSPPCTFALLITVQHLQNAVSEIFIVLLRPHLERMRSEPEDLWLPVIFEYYLPS